VGVDEQNKQSRNHFEKSLADTPTATPPSYHVGLAFSFGTPSFLENALAKNHPAGHFQNLQLPFPLLPGVGQTFCKKRFQKIAAAIFLP
jgi:hypothetical protein